MNNMNNSILNAKELADLNAMDDLSFTERSLLNTIADLTQSLAASEAHWVDCCKMLERELAELRQPMSCGHPKACWVEGDPPPVGTVSTSMVHHPELYGMKQVYTLGHCTACVQSQAEREALDKLATAVIVHLEQDNCLTYEEVLTALAAARAALTGKAPVPR
jgi:hypothetical protein